jgi:hypothetical protein
MRLLSTVQGPIDITHGFSTSTDIYAFVVYLQENERCGANAEVRPPPSSPRASLTRTVHRTA